MPPPPVVTVGHLLRGRADAYGLGLELLAGATGLDREITSPYIQKTGLALAGYHEYLRPGRVLIYGDSEIRYLQSLSADVRLSVLTKSFEAGVPLLRTSISTPLAIGKLMSMLEDRLASREVVHGVLMDVLGLGVLIVGESGIGKSECALDLLGRGHRLVADDTVEVRRRAETVIIGTAPAATRYYMEIRGLGLVNVRDLFGVASTRSSKRVEFVVEFERWDTGRNYDRLGLDELHHDLIGLRVPKVTMPVAPGRNVATLVEVAARNQLLRARGIHTARDFVQALDARLARGGGDEFEDPDDLDGGGAA